MYAVITKNANRCKDAVQAETRRQAPVTIEASAPHVDFSQWVAEA